MGQTKSHETTESATSLYLPAKVCGSDLSFLCQHNLDTTATAAHGYTPITSAGANTKGGCVLKHVHVSKGRNLQQAIDKCGG